MLQSKTMPIRTAGLLAVSLALAGCQVAGPVGYGRPNIPQQTGVEGNWLGTDGVAISTFRSGTFTSYALDTGNALARGTYTMTAANTASIALTSLIRNTTTRVNCLVVNPSQMNCTTQTGAQFTLLRTNRQPPTPVEQPVPAVNPGLTPS